MDKKKIIIVVLCFAFFILLMMGINYLISRSEQVDSADPGEDAQGAAVEIQPPAQPKKQLPAVQEQSDPQPQSGPMNI